MCCVTAKGDDNRESIECHHKYIGDEIEKRKFHMQNNRDKKRNAKHSSVSVILAKRGGNALNGISSQCEVESITALDSLCTFYEKSTKITGNK